MFDIEIAEFPTSKLCQNCGKDLVFLVTPETVFCTYAALDCANPCGFRSIEPVDGVPVVCRHRTEPVIRAVLTNIGSV